jgi:predicted enzyme related to lactoylglutathione lyase
MLNKSNAATRLPAQDLERARKFYAEKLGVLDLTTLIEEPDNSQQRVINQNWRRTP